MKLTPQSLGLPSQFDQWRSCQEQGLHVILESPKRHTGISSPTGCVSGDTIITINRAGIGKSLPIGQFYKRRQDSRRRSHVKSRIRSMLDDRIGLHDMDDREIVYSGERPTYTLALVNGKTLRATADHLIYTWDRYDISEDCCIPLGDLRPDDLVVCEGLPTKASKASYRQVQGLLYHRYHGLAGSYSPNPDNSAPEGILYRVPYHRLVMEAYMNDIEVAELIEICRKDKIRAASLDLLDPVVYVVHHKDRDYLNNILDNLEVMTHEEHKLVHSLENIRNFACPIGVEVESVTKYGTEPTFDACCTDPYHNFVANKIVVHNSGKSLMMVGAGIASNKRVCIVTASKGLQDQYTKDFEEIGMVDLRGLSNYECGLKPDYTCQEGKAVRCPYWGTVQCPYSQTEMRASTSRLIVTNYSKWLLTRKDMGCLSGIDMLILDECHQSPQELSDAMQVILHHKEIEEDLGLKFLNGEESKEFWNWKLWAKAARAVCEVEVLAARARLGGPDCKTAWIYHYNHMRKLLDRIATLALANPADWVCEEIKEGWQFDPIRPARYAEGKLFCGVPRVVFSSATVRPKTLYMLGLSKERFDFHEFPSEFDASRCPTYYIPTMRMDHRQENYEPLYTRIDQIMGRRSDRKGLIHSVSWKRLAEITENCRYGSRMLTNEKGESATQAVESFKASPPPFVLASPSIGLGFDFPMGAAEYQIITKIPFQDGRSLIVKARQENDRDYGPYNAMQNLVQMAGRIMRSKDDQGETFLVDDHASWFVPKYSVFAPRSFHQFFKTVNTLPPPPPRL